MPELQDCVLETIAWMAAANNTIEAIAAEVKMARQTVATKLRSDEVQDRILEITRIKLSKYEISLEDIAQAVADIGMDVRQPADVRLRALTALGKHLGGFKERAEVAGTVVHEHNVSPSVREKLDEVYKSSAS